MELKQFVAETLEQIVLGVAEAQQAVTRNNAVVNPATSGRAADAQKKDWDGKTGLPIEPIEFDVAVTVTQDKDKAGKAAIEVLGIGFGAGASSATSNTVASRVRFTVPLLLPGGSQRPTMPTTDTAVTDDNPTSY